MKYELILSWNNPKDKMWIPIGRLTFKDNCYYFNYTYGAKASKNFKSLEKMDDLTKTYQSEELFPLFKNRLLQKSRPEYVNYLQWLNISNKEMHPMEELSLTGGVRATDSLQLFPIPVKKDGYYIVTFFTNGMRYLPSCNIQELNELEENSKVLVMKDIQNECDNNALMLRSQNPSILLGYCPKNYVKDFNYLIDVNGGDKVNLRIVKNNKNAPSRLKLLCEFKTKWAEGFIPFKDKDFQKINEEDN